MKGIIAIAVVLSCIGASYQQEDHQTFIEELKAKREQCVKETGVDKELPIKALRDGDFPEDQNLKCYFKCMFQKAGHMSDKGEVDFSSFIEHIPPTANKDKATEILNKCKDMSNSDLCQAAFDFAKCLREAFGPIKHD